MALVPLALTVVGFGALIVVVMMEGTLIGEGSVVVVVVGFQECWQVFEVTQGPAQSCASLFKLEQAIQVSLAPQERGGTLLSEQGVGLPVIKQAGRLQVSQ